MIGTEGSPDAADREDVHATHLMSRRGHGILDAMWCSGALRHRRPACGAQLVTDDERARELLDFYLGDVLAVILFCIHDKTISR